MNHVVMFSGGLSSWATCYRIDPAEGDRLCLVFADTKMEDPDLYRFVDDAVQAVIGECTSSEFVRLTEGRDPWQVFFDVKLIGNTRADPCSRILKRKLIRDWLDAELDPADTTVYIGFTWDEAHRYERAKAYWEPWTVAAPLCDPPYLTKADMISMAYAEGITPPRLTLQGFPHNNCGGFCVKAGQAQFAKLLELYPDRYAQHEELERAFRAEREAEGKPESKWGTILRDRRGGDTTPMTMETFRKRVQAGKSYDLHEWGGCTCMEPGDDEQDSPPPPSGRSRRDD